MHASVIVFPGSNCDRDVQVALAASMGSAPEMVWHGDSTLPKTDLIVLPGGFSYGDYLRSGAMAAQSPIMRDVVAAAGRGTPVLAICNGFQVATEAGLLPGALMRNASLKFVCRDVWLRVENPGSQFTGAFTAGDVVRMPIAHHDGNYFLDDDGLDRIEGAGQVAFRYCGETGQSSDSDNPNGSARHIAGVFNEGRTVLGMMPHPERLADDALGGSDGKTMFDGLISSIG